MAFPLGPVFGRVTQQKSAPTPQHATRVERPPCSPHRTAPNGSQLRCWTCPRKHSPRSSSSPTASSTSSRRSTRTLPPVVESPGSTTCSPTCRRPGTRRGRRTCAHRLPRCEHCPSPTTTTAAPRSSSPNGSRRHSRRSTPASGCAPSAPSPLPPGGCAARST